MIKAFVLALAVVAGAAQAQDRVLDDLTDPERWTVLASDDVHANLHRADDGRGLCLDYDFGRVLGYVSLRRSAEIEFSAPVQFELALRGRGAPHTFQFKLVDASGDNVWWLNRPQFQFPDPWQPLTWTQAQIEFAWGPASDHRLTRTAALELVVAAGTAGGSGQACFDHLVMRAAATPVTAAAQPRVIAGDAALTLDFGAAREFDALRMRWRAGTAPAAYAIEYSDDGQSWRRARQVDDARAPEQPQWLPQSRTRFVRVRVDRASGLTAVLLGIEPIVVANADAFFAGLAASAPRGTYPRAHTGEQVYWSVLGVDGGKTAALLSEDGVVEPRPGVGALEPFVLVDGHVLDWADVQAAHALEQADLPMPRVRWRARDVTLDVDAFGAATPDAQLALVRYTVANHGVRRRDVSLALAWRPFQVNPPTQFLAHPGGVVQIRELAWDGALLSVNGAPALRSISPPDTVHLAPLAAGPATEWLSGGVPGAAPARCVDPAGYASGVLRYRMHLRPGQRRVVEVALPIEGQAVAAMSPRDVAALRARTETHWRDRLDRVRISGPAPVADIMRSVRSALGDILVERHAAALQPGPRAYARSWIRDGSLMSSALLRLGQDDVARDFVQWYAPFQFSSGKVPCCATDAGADPVPENDSDGEFAFAVADLWRYTHDRDTAQALWPNVRAAVAHMEALRQSERIPANREAPNQAYFGLMPPSISHEGYSDKPAYSYWDDFWAAIGYRSAVELATALGLSADAQRLSAQRDDFVADVLASLQASTAQHHLDVLPGSADRGDVDPAASTVALSPGGLLGTLPQPLVERTFERYWSDFVARRDGALSWQAYTPYEWRIVGSLVRLGERDRAQQLMAFLYEGQRPAGWRLWAEVVWHDPRAARFIGDMPHGWVAADQIRSVLDLFAFEHEGRQSLVLAAGVPEPWLRGPGLVVQGLRTPYGALTWRTREQAVGSNRRVVFELAPLDRSPPGGIELRGPWPADARVWIDGRRVVGDASTIPLRAPARVVVEYAAPPGPRRWPSPRRTRRDRPAPATVGRLV